MNSVSHLLPLLIILLLGYLLEKTLAAIVGTAEYDYIDSLPDFGRPPTSQYSGYLDATPGCDTSQNGNFCYVHYWLSFAEESPEEKPLILWLNGGPGSSSVIGYLQENGPLLMSLNGTLIKNPYSWTKVANYLILESPLGVGYSYCENQRHGKICVNTDRWTARLNMASLVDLYRKFPQLVDNDLFLTGESYAGVYIPTLAYEILQYNANNQNKDQRPIPLRGLAVGDPCTDNDSQRESMNPLWYAHKYGLVDDDVYHALKNDCEVRQEYIPNGRYEIPHNNYRLHTFDSPECRLALRKYLLSSSHGILNSRKWNESFIDRYSLFAHVTAVTDIAMNTYMNRDDVRRALHVHSAPVDTWPRPSLGWQYTKEYAACNGGADIDDSSVSMINFYSKIVPRLERTWIYNGDTDPCVSYEGTRTAVKRIGYGEIDGGGYRPWFYNHTAASLDFIENKAPLFGPNLVPIPLGAQFGGETVQYDHSLSFLTVHGSGHMVPQFHPQAALHMISKFVSYEYLTPLWPSNATLATVNSTEFKMLLEQWTESAKVAPYVK
jgi:cathepsin A (carboxypeptidase C)